jgi:hypothetical protein
MKSKPERLNRPHFELPSMSVLLTQANEVAVQGSVIDAAGWVVLLGGVLLTVFWLRSLGR